MATKRVKATFDYLATEPGELSIKKGDIINVLEEDDTGWWKGELKGLIGFFPSNFSEVIPEDNEPSDKAQRRMSMAPKPKKDNEATQQKGEFVRAKHNYKGSAADGELSFSKGDILKVVNKDESGWWKGELNGKTGFFPHNFVVAAPAPAAAPAPQTVSPRSVNAPKNAQKMMKKTVKKNSASTVPAKQQQQQQQRVESSNAGAAAVAAAVAAAEKDVAEAQQRTAEAQEETQRAIARAEEAEAALQEAQAASAKVKELEKEKEEEKEKTEKLENQMAEWEGQTVGEMDINELRELKHRLKASLELVGKALSEQKACPGCETRVKNCIIVPCLHAFCHKCGEKNKKLVKCSICGVAPERIYMLGKK